MYSAVYGKTEKIIEILPYSSRKGVGRNVFGSLMIWRFPIFFMERERFTATAGFMRSARGIL